MLNVPLSEAHNCVTMTYTAINMPPLRGLKNRLLHGIIGITITGYQDITVLTKKNPQENPAGLYKIN